MVRRVLYGPRNNLATTRSVKCLALAPSPTGLRVIWKRLSRDLILKDQLFFLQGRALFARHRPHVHCYYSWQASASALQLRDLAILRGTWDPTRFHQLTKERNMKPVARIGWLQVGPTGHTLRRSVQFRSDQLFHLLSKRRPFPLGGGWQISHPTSVSHLNPTSTWK